jgi:hypothetical protein
VAGCFENCDELCFHKMQGVSWLAENQLAFKEGLLSMELVDNSSSSTNNDNIIVIIIIIIHNGTILLYS